jgi:CubicO group peptidase (beta-lactamase class C family)
VSCGEHLGAFAHREIFMPLAMSSTGPCFSNTPNDRPNRRGHNLPASAHPGRGAR